LAERLRSSQRINFITRLGQSERGQKRPEGQQVKISRRFPAAVIANSVLMRNVSRSTWSHAEDCWGLIS